MCILSTHCTTYTCGTQTEESECTCQCMCLVINPRRACAARVTVVVLCVCQCVQALLTQLQDQVDIPTDSVSCSLQNEFGVFCIMA